MHIIGYQVANAVTGEHWNGRPSFEILTLATAVKDLNEAALSGSGQYQMVAIKAGDIEEPTFEDSKVQAVGISTSMRNNDNPVGTPSIEASISIAYDGSFLLRAKGYSDCTTDDDYGVPLVIENLDGKLILRVFGDINQEDPTEVISLDGARNELRLP